SQASLPHDRHRRGPAAEPRGAARRASARRGRSGIAPSDVPDVLAPGLRVVFCGINPGRVSAAAQAHFANPRNDFWRLLHAARFTSRLYEPSEQFELLKEGIGVTNAAYRTTPGSGDLRRSDFAGSAARLEQLAHELRPGRIGFVGKDPGESDGPARRRELREELGLRDFELGPLLWTREQWFRDEPGHCGQRENVYLLRTAAFEPAPELDLAAEGCHELRWLTADEV